MLLGLLFSATEVAAACDPEPLPFSGVLDAKFYKFHLNEASFSSLTSAEKTVIQAALREGLKLWNANSCRGDGNFAWTGEGWAPAGLCQAYVVLRSPDVAVSMPAWHKPEGGKGFDSRPSHEFLDWLEERTR